MGEYKKFPMPEYSTALSRSLVDVILNFFAKHTSTIEIFEAFDPNISTYNNMYDIVNEVLYNIRSKIIVRLEEYNYISHSENKKTFNIILVDSYSSFLKIYSKIHPDYFDYRGFYLIALVIYDRDQYSQMKRILEKMWAIYITRVNVILRQYKNENEAVMFTYYPFSPFYCEQVHPVVHNYFIDTNFTMNNEHFPRKTKNLHKCPIKVAAFNVPPYMILTKLQNGSYHTDGIEGILLRVLSQRMNFTVDVDIVPEKWGIIHRNGSSTGSLRKVISNQVNLTIGCYSITPLRYYYTTSSYTYYTSETLWQIPPGESFTSIEKLKKPFSLFFWLCIFSTLVTSCLFILYIKYYWNTARSFVFGKSNSSPIINLLNIFFGGSLSILPKRNFARFLLTCFTLYSLIIRSSYQGALYQFLQQDSRSNEVASTDEMISKDFAFYMTESAFNTAQFADQVNKR